MGSRVFRTVAVLAAFSLAGLANAAVNTYTFTSVVSSMFIHDHSENKNTSISTGSFLSKQISIGDKITGTVTINDTGTRSPYSPENGSGMYVYDNIAISSTLSVASAGFSYVGGGGNAVLGNNNAPTGWDTISFSSSAPYNPNFFHHLYFSLYDPSGTVLDASYKLPGVFDLAKFYTKSVDYGYLDRSSNDQIHFSGTLQTLTLAPIPEPETYAMLLAGLAVMGFVAGKKSRVAV